MPEYRRLNYRDPRTQKAIWATIDMAAERSAYHALEELEEYLYRWEADPFLLSEEEAVEELHRIEKTLEMAQRAAKRARQGPQRRVKAHRRRA